MTQPSQRIFSYLTFYTNLKKSSINRNVVFKVATEDTKGRTLGGGGAAVSSSATLKTTIYHKIKIRF